MCQGQVQRFRARKIITILAMSNFFSNAVTYTKYEPLPLKIIFFAKIQFFPN